MLATSIVKNADISSYKCRHMVFFHVGRRSYLLSLTPSFTLYQLLLITLTLNVISPPYHHIKSKFDSLFTTTLKTTKPVSKLKCFNSFKFSSTIIRFSRHRATHLHINLNSQMRF